FFSCSRPIRRLHSFPTRRSSDLETDAEGLPFPSVNSSTKTKLATLASRADPKVIPRTRDSPGAREGIVQLYRLPWLDRGIEPLSDRKSTRLNSSHLVISYAVFCL